MSSVAIFKRLLPVLQHLARFPGANARALCGRHGVALDDLQRFVEKEFGSFSNLEEESLEVTAKRFGVTLLAWKPTQPAVKSVQVEAPVVMPRFRAADRGKVEAVEKLATPPPKAPPAPALKPPAGADLADWFTAQALKPRAVNLSFEVDLAPAIAVQWLKLNVSNRKPSKAKIKRFAAAMKARRWTLNGETIKFSSSGRLLDGQSRLMAIVMAGISVPVEVRGGLPDFAQESMDCGEIRRGSHTLEMMGEDNPQICAPALRQLWIWEKGYLGGFPFGASRVMENSELKPLLEKHAGIKRSVGWAVTVMRQLRGLMPPSEGAFFHYLLGLADPKLRDSFCEALVEGVGLTKASPVYHLREKLLELRRDGIKGSSNNANGGKVYRAALVIKAWNAARDGEKMTCLIWRHKGELAEKFPVLELKGEV